MKGTSKNEKSEPLSLLSSFGFLLWLMIGFSFTQITYQSFYDWLMFKVPSNELEPRNPDLDYLRGGNSDAGEELTCLRILRPNS